MPDCKIIMPFYSKFLLYLTPVSCFTISMEFSMGLMSSFCVLSDREVNTVADRVPEEGLNVSLSVVTFNVDVVPVETGENPT